jgi:hypothetical protein
VLDSDVIQSLLAVPLEGAQRRTTQEIDNEEAKMDRLLETLDVIQTSLALNWAPRDLVRRRHRGEPTTTKTKEMDRLRTDDVIEELVAPYWAHQEQQRRQHQGPTTKGQVA